MPVSQVYLISEQYPATNKLRKGFDVATAELRRHVELLRFLCYVIMPVSSAAFVINQSISRIYRIGTISLAN